MNHLAHATSPYLLQHRHNPVDWWQWGPEALAEAKRNNKPILLSIGYAACHWCHVMAHESFEDTATAEVMNELFVCIKVDREERPDIDHIYMSALHALGEQGGWPLTMFLTPAGEPIWGGTYFPKEARFGRPAFVSVLREISRIYHEEPHRIAHNRDALLRSLAESSRHEGGAGLTMEHLDRVGMQLQSAFDMVDGGLTGAPKFPNCGILELMWRHAHRRNDSNSRRIVEVALERMARGGIQDHLGGGFARYSVDARWLVPHFEKMLYDNAQLLELYALFASESDNPIFEQAACGIVRWLEREMVVEGGAFAASLDADSEGVEGRFYVWSAEEIAAILGPERFAVFALHYDVTPEGNWEGHVVLNRLDTPDPDAPTEAILTECRTQLLTERERRTRPDRDDKVLADWNGLMISALVRAGLILARPDWIALAQRAYRFVAESMTRDGSLGHSWREGHLLAPGFASDHAALARAALVLQEATGDPNYGRDADKWLAVLARDYINGETGILAMTVDSQPDLVIRPDPTHDDVTPNANGLYAEVLVRKALASRSEHDLRLADAVLDRLTAAARRSPVGHASILNALDLRLRGATIEVPAEPETPAAAAFLGAALRTPYPIRVVVRGSHDDTASGEAAPLARQEGTALVCAGERCSLPIHEPSALASEVEAMTHAGN